MKEVKLITLQCRNEVQSHYQQDEKTDIQTDQTTSSLPNIPSLNLQVQAITNQQSDEQQSNQKRPLDDSPSKPIKKQKLDPVSSNTRTAHFVSGTEGEDRGRKKEEARRA